MKNKLILKATPEKPKKSEPWLIFPSKPQDSVSIHDFAFLKQISKGAFGQIHLVQRTNDLTKKK